MSNQTSKKNVSQRKFHQPEQVKQFLHENFEQETLYPCIEGFAMYFRENKNILDLILDRLKICEK